MSVKFFDTHTHTQNCIQCPFFSDSTIRPHSSTLASNGWLWLVHGAQDLLSPPGLALPPAAGSRSSSASPKPAPAALGSATKAGLRLVHVCGAAKRRVALPGSARLPGAAGRNGGRRRVPSPCLSPATGALRAAPHTPGPPVPASPPPRSRCGSTGTRPSFCSRRRRRCGSGST